MLLQDGNCLTWGELSELIFSHQYECQHHHASTVCYFGREKCYASTFIVVVDLITTVPDTLSPGVKVLDGRLSFISRIVDDIVTLQENINVYDSSQLFQTDSAVQ